MKEVTPHSVKIDGKGYILRPGSYQSAKRPVNVDKFSTGQVAYEDLADQDAWAQSDWRGGFDQEFDLDRSKFMDSENINILDDVGSFQLAGNLSTIIDTAVESGVKDRRDGDWYVATNSILKYGDDITSSFSTAANLSGTITDIENIDGTTYAAVPENKVLWESPTPTVAASWSATTTASFDVTFTEMEPYGGFLYLTNGSTRLRKYDGTGAASGFISAVDSTEWKIINIKEYNGRLYMGCVGRDNVNKLALRVYDGSVDWTVTEWNNVQSGSDSFQVMQVFNNKLHFNVNGLTNDNSVTMLSWDGQTAIETMSLDEQYVSLLVGPPTTHNNIVDSITLNGKMYLLIVTGNGAAYGITRIYANGGDYWYKYQEATTPGASDGGVLITHSYSVGANGAGYLHAMTNTSSGLIETYDDGGTSLEDQYTGTGNLESSIIDMDLFSIDKQVNSVEVYHQALPVDTAVVTNLYTHGDDDTSGSSAQVTNSIAGTQKSVLKLTDDNVGKRFRYDIQLSAFNNQSATPVVEDVVMRYILEPDYNKVWTFELHIQDNMDTRNGRKEKRTALEMKRDLERAASKAVTDFVDVDGIVYDNEAPDSDKKGVIIRDIQFRAPYDFSGETPEFIATVTLTEA